MRSVQTRPSRKPATRLPPRRAFSVSTADGSDAPLSPRALRAAGTVAELPRCSAHPDKNALSEFPGRALRLPSAPRQGWAEEMRDKARPVLMARPLLLRSREPDHLRVGLYLLRQAAAPGRQRRDGLRYRLILPRHSGRQCALHRSSARTRSVALGPQDWSGGWNPRKLRLSAKPKIEAGLARCPQVVAARRRAAVFLSCCSLL